jgi:hypothetical protein
VISTDGDDEKASHFFGGRFMKAPFRAASCYALSAILIVISLSGCDGSDGDSAISTAMTPTGATALLAWDPVEEPTVSGYYIYYGKVSSGEIGSCLYEHAEFVSSPPALITGLEPNTQYYFAISTFNGANGRCSEEISTITPATQV